MNFIFLPKDSDPDAMYVISKWYVSTGDKVNIGDVLVSYEQDKSIVDVISEYDGVITEIYALDGDVIESGSKIGAIS